MKYNQNEIPKIKSFFDACNEMISGRFILSDIKISKILKSIANSEFLYHMFADTLSNFKFKEQYDSCISSTKINGGYFVLPESDKKIAALVFCLLLEVDNHKMNLQNFVNEYFYSPEGYNFSYSNFAINVLIPFKNSVLSILGCDEQGEFVTEEDEEEVMEELQEVYEPHDHTEKLLYANLRMSLNELMSEISNSKCHPDVKDELTIIINALFEAIELENLKIINALIIPMEHMLSKHKHLKYYYSDFKENLINYYYN